MNILFFGSHTDQTHKEVGESPEHSDHNSHLHDESLDEGGEYVDDALRMVDQTFNLD